MDEGDVPDAEERDPSVFWDDNKGPVVMVWDGRSAIEGALLCEEELQKEK